MGWPGKLTKTESELPLEVSGSVAAGTVRNEARTRKTRPMGKGYTNASALEVGWLVGPRRECAKGSMNFKEILGRKMGI